MSHGRVASKASSFQLLAEPDHVADRTKIRSRVTWVQVDGLDQSGLTVARFSRAKYLAIVAILVVSASLAVSVL